MVFHVAMGTQTGKSEKAYEIYNKAMMDRGVFLNDAQWKDVLKNKAETCLNKKYYQRFLNDNGFAS